jgi:tetratricopeptide (TPR) repeat protein
MMRYFAAMLLSAGLLMAQRPVPGSVQTPAGKVSTAQRERAYRANNIGVARLEQFDYKAAEQSFREALKLHPELGLARLNLAIAELYAGRPADAAGDARAAAKRLPEAPQAHYVLGLAGRAENNLDEAAAAFTRVLQIDSSDPGAKVQLGQIYLQQRRFDEALKLFQEALAAEPHNVTAAYSVSLALTRAGRTDEGRAAMQQFEKLRDSPYGFTYAQTYLSQGKYAEAIASTGAEAELVSAALPDVTFADATATMLPASGPAGATPGPRGNLTLFDADGDGDLDLFDIRPSGQRFLRNQNGVFTDDTATAGLGADVGEASVAVAGDYNNDGRPDLFISAASGYVLFNQNANGTFENVTAKVGFPAPGKSLSGVAAADVDHDGDLDLLVGGSPAQLLRNNGDGTFADIAGAAGLAPAGPALAIAATDYDNRRDIDFVAMASGGPRLYRNMRDGTFRDATADAGLVQEGAYDAALAVGDINKDGYIDLFFSRTSPGGVLALSDGQTGFRLTPAPSGTSAATAARFADYDNDGLLDLLTIHRRGLRLFRNAGKQWVDATAEARLPADAGDAGAGITAVGLGDLDSDGDSDIVMALDTGALRFLRNDGGSRNASLRTILTARASNRSGVGAKVEIRAGSLRQMLEASSSSPAVAPADLIFGLGGRQSADVVRVLWPSGILQAETEPQTAKSPVGRRAPLTITELDRKPSSCPYLFTWNGTRFEFVTDFMGGGEMGAWLAPAMWNQPDPDEYVRIRADQLAPRDGRYEIRLTNELEEALFFDRVQLLAIDHPDDVEVFPNEGLRSPPRPAFALSSVARARPPARAVDEHGHDVLPQLTSIDRRYPDDFGLMSIRGYAEPHELILDLGAAEAPVLLLTGWTDYAFSNDNVAASQRRVTLSPPSLQVKDRQGVWRTVIPEIGFPVGRPQTIPVNLAGKFLSSNREVRILTNMRIYWDQILVGDAVSAPLRVTRLDAAAADLRWRGLSAEVTPDGREPYGYDYQRVSSVSPWKVMAGRYTREGDVRELLQRIDDMFVISLPGDEVALTFEALPQAGPRWRRTFLLFSQGYSKEMNPRSASPDTVAPLPFRGMSGYPYSAGERYPGTKAHLEYQERYNTRVVVKSLPSIDGVGR